MSERRPQVDWLKQARKSYIDSSERKIADLEQAISALDSEPANSDAREHLRILLHNLIGSGASYGFPTISVIARKMSSALKRATDDRIIIESGLVNHLGHELTELTEAFAKERGQFGD